VNASSYYTLCSYAGRHLLRTHPWPVPATDPFPLRFTAAVYVAVSVDDGICYVGSVSRPNGGLAARVSEHLADPVKRSAWHSLWVVPLLPETDRREVRRIEGVVGAHLRPLRSRRLPRPAPPSREELGGHEPEAVGS
jgi:hypothetical protein